MVKNIFCVFLFAFGSLTFVQARVNTPQLSPQASEKDSSSNFGLFRNKVEQKLIGDEITEEVGFIGLSVIARGEFGLHRQADASQKLNAYPMIFSLGLLSEGATSGHQIDTRITLLYDAIHVASYFTGRGGDFKKNELYSYSFFNLASTYRVAGKKNAFFHVGFALGHQGFLHKSLSKPAYSIYPAFSIGMRWFISKKVLMRLHSEILIPIVNVNVKAIFYQTNRMEFVFDPKGNIRSPSTRSVLLVLGLDNINVFLNFADGSTLQKYTVAPSFRVLFLF